jgi:hypothetical protein
MALSLRAFKTRDQQRSVTLTLPLPQLAHKAYEAGKSGYRRHFEF